jgi:hypothetical protein
MFKSSPIQMAWLVHGLETCKKHASSQNSVASEGFEPPKAEPADLQSDPFGRLGN